MKKHIAYLIPEFPSVSMTFVTNEMAELKRRNIPLTIFALHGSVNRNLDPKSFSLKNNVDYVYDRMKGNMLSIVFSSIAKKPMKTAGLFLHALKSSVFSLRGKNRISNMGHFIAGLHVGRILEEKNIHHIHAHFAHYPASVAMYASLYSGVTFSFTAHANDIFENQTLLSEKEKSAKKVIVISEFNRKHFEDQSNLDVVRCGIDLNEYKFVGTQPSNSVLKIGTLGRLVEKKGFDVLLNAAAIIKKNRVKFELHIAGSGPEKDNLVALADQLGISENIRWEGSMSNEKVSEWLQTLDVFALACKQDRNGDMDGIPVVLMEAMATGIPVISTEISGIPELIKNGLSGMLAKPGCPADFAAALQRFYANRTRMSIVASNARMKIENEFSLERSTDQLIEIFGV